ncbi:MAG: redoxin domain-containing protein [Ignavibacteriae bacterium]|nr:redoxin domain-containing protein [Ignavibacteriota bacterium]
MALSVGQIAPEFSLYDETKTLRSLSEFRGKNVVLAFYPGAFTGVCDKEVCAFQDAMSQLSALNSQVIGISVDMPFTGKVFSERYNLGFPLLSDFNREVIKKYDILLHDFAGIPGLDSCQRTVYLLDSEGVIRYVEVTANPGVEPNYAALMSAIEALK